MDITLVLLFWFTFKWCPSAVCCEIAFQVTSGNLVFKWLPSAVCSEMAFQVTSGNLLH